MAPKRKSQSSSAAIIPPIDPNSQLPFAGNHMSVVSESDLLHLVSIGVLPPKELCSWWICRGVTVPTEDTHESVIYVPFLIRGLALPISPFFMGKDFPAACRWLAGEHQIQLEEDSSSGKNSSFGGSSGRGADGEGYL